MLKFLLVKVGNKDSYSGLDKTRQWPAYPDSPGSIILKQQSSFGGTPLSGVSYGRASVFQDQSGSIVLGRMS